MTGDKKKIIVHILKADSKFNSGYIAFMNKCMGKYDHFFIIVRNNRSYDSDDGGRSKDVIICKHRSELLFDRLIRNAILKCDKLIISGFFAGEEWLGIYSQNIWDKIYIQFWGGDYCVYRNEVLRNKRQFRIRKKCIQRCNAVINLIDYEYEEFEKITGIRKKHFVAPVGLYEETENASDFDELEEDGYVRVLIGNSATEENGHVEVFKWLARYRDENVKFIVPLSYGEMDYKEKVLCYGRELLGNAFEPLTQFLSKDEYKRLLNRCEIGVFNNNRQQALGNINKLICMKKKVFVRGDISTWKYYNSNNITLYDTRTIADMDFKDFILCENSIKDANLKNMKCIQNNDTAIKLWSQIFDD